MSAALVFEAVSIAYDGRPALSQVDAEFAAGVVTGIVGPNGAGKTTLLRAALGILRPAAGRISVGQRPLADWSREALARNIAYLPQGGEAHWPLAVRDLVALGRLPHRGRLSALSPADEAAIRDALSRADAQSLAMRRSDALSAGERARVLFARALATQAPILLADEPAAFLDPAHQLRLMELLREEARRGVAVVVTLHDLSLAARFCDRVLVLHHGRVASCGAPEAALDDAVLACVFGIAALRTVDPAGGGGVLTPWRLL